MGLFSFVGKAFKKAVGIVKGVVTHVAAPVLRTVASTVTHGASEKLLTAIHLVKAAGPVIQHPTLSLMAGESRSNDPLLMQKFKLNGLKLLPKPGQGNVTAMGTKAASVHKARLTTKRRKKHKPKVHRAKTTRKTRGRLPKFGSPAWRKRFHLGKKKKKAA